MTDGIELIECAPYSARITPRACGLRAAKARLLAKRKVPAVNVGGVGLVGALAEVEKCLTCPAAREVGAADKCSDAKCAKAPIRDGMCSRHAQMKAAMARREKMMVAEEYDAAACKDCGRQKTECTGFNDELSLCSKCIEARGRKSMAKAKGKTCAKCGRDDTGRVYKGLCPECRGKCRTTVSPSPGQGRGRDESDKKARKATSSPAFSSEGRPHQRGERVEADDIEAVRVISRTLEPFDPPVRERILRWVNERMELRT